MCQESSQLFLSWVFIFHHGLNAKMALEELHNINSQMNAYPEGAVVIAGDYKSQT